ncbi:molybdopterin-binding protein [Natrialbaceae archaeon A-gly3]
MSERGVTVGEIRVVPDTGLSIKAAVTEFSAEFDRTIVTGGLGSTPDDVTLEAVARALDRSLKENDAARADIERTVREIETEYPGFEHDVDAAARFPPGARVIPNDEGIVPGCVICGHGRSSPTHRRAT